MTIELSTAAQFFLPMYHGDHSAFDSYKNGEIKPDAREIDALIDVTFESMQQQYASKASEGEHVDDDLLADLAQAQEAYASDPDFAARLRAWCVEQAEAAYAGWLERNPSDAAESYFWVWQGDLNPSVYKATSAQAAINAACRDAGYKDEAAVRRWNIENGWGTDSGYRAEQITSAEAFEKMAMHPDSTVSPMEALAIANSEVFSYGRMGDHARLTFPDGSQLIVSLEVVKT